MGILSAASKLIPSWWKLALYGAIIVVVIGVAGRIGYDIRDYSAQKTINAEQANELKQKQQYEKDLATAIAKQQSISKELQDALTANQNVVAKTITRTVVKEIHDHPVYVTCVVPVSGVKLLNNQATQLNSIRGVH